MRQKIIYREICVRKPGTKTGKQYLKLGLPEEIFFKEAKKCYKDSSTGSKTAEEKNANIAAYGANSTDIAKIL